MKKIFLQNSQPLCVLILLFLCVIDVLSIKANTINSDKEPAVIGRWDLTVTIDGKQYPSWLEVQSSGYILVGQFVGIVGNARPISRINFDDNKLTFTVPPQWEEGKNDLSFSGTLQGDSLNGTMVSADGKNYNWSAVRAPKLKSAAQPVWGKSVKLFDGNNIDGWHASGDNQWIAKDGVLKSPKSGANLITDRNFKDFKLHIEFRYPEGSNSGVYLRGRYEVQIEASHEDEPIKGVFSSIYGFIEPSEMASKQPNEWQSYDITLVGRMVTVVANGKTVICNREIPGITGGALNSKEGEPGPLMIQGDHGPIEYKNIVITPAD